ncbi:MAG: LysM peptidoglycan-binding domain-containing protein [Opitutaceae bacterium]|jgi:LysM repeat protein|nr:LysM peptidoglycan-binding domain-containing protein [Opitutaceae bacterium]
MDTISRDSNGTSYLPVAGVILGVIGLVLGGVALAKVSTINKQLVSHGDIASRASAAEDQAQNAAALANQINQRIGAVEKHANEIQTATASAFQNAGSTIQEMRSEIVKLQDTVAGRRPSVAVTPGNQQTGGGTTTQPRTPVVAGAGEYIVKSGDNGTRIAAANGVKLADLMAVNPEVNWNRLHVGQKLKLPQR